MSDNFIYIPVIYTKVINDEKIDVSKLKPENLGFN